MNYFVIWPDGRRFGPADLATLNAWAQEGRLTPANVLEEEGTATRLTAQQLPGLTFEPTEAPTTQPPLGQPAGAMASYYRDPRATATYAGNNEVTWAWVLGALGLACCPVVGPIFGIVLANKAKQAGHPTANAARIFSIVILALNSLWVLFYAVVAIATGFH